MGNDPTKQAEVAQSCRPGVRPLGDRPQIQDLFLSIAKLANHKKTIDMIHRNNCHNGMILWFENKK
jgi:hypothetical protein